MIKLETKRLILRNYNESDFDYVFQYFSNEDVSKYEDFYPMTAEEVKNIINEWKEMDHRLVVELKSTQNVIGSIGYWTDNEGHHCFDYDFNPKYGGNGYATEVGKVLVNHLFETIGVDAVYGDCDIRNSTNIFRILYGIDLNRTHVLLCK